MGVNLSHIEPKCIWFTGLSGAGKSTLANALVEELQSAGKLVYLLDGDLLRRGINKDLGFTDADRVENIRRVAEIARLMVDAGLIVVVALISPFTSDRAVARRLFNKNQFIEIYVSATLAACESRDIKGLYKRARNGEIANFTGIDSPYEPPICADIVIDSVSSTSEEAGLIIFQHLSRLVD
jgi:bifunctional enzyme CysN/CysC